MGITFALLEKLQSHGVFSMRPARVLDIGSSNLYQADAERVRNFVRLFDPSLPAGELAEFAERMARGSAYDPVKGGLNEAFAGELLERCGIEYLSFDIAKGYRTEVFDLNWQGLPEEQVGSFDTVLNIGTTEHLLNQFNAFKVIHEAAKPGGYIVHQLPVSGFTDHGYFVYTGRLFFDMASFNRYRIVDLWYDGPAGTDDVYTSVNAYERYFEPLRRVPRQAVAVPNCALTIIFQKNDASAFKACLETSTSVGEIPASVHIGYAGSVVAAAPRILKRTAIARRVRRWLRG